MESNDSGWITIDRKIRDWEWYQDISVKTLFFECLLAAQWADTKYKGVLVKRGQFITSIPKLAESTGLSIKQVRRALKCLVGTGEVADNASSKGRIITVMKYDEYQNMADKKADKGQTKGRLRADKGQTEGTLNNNINNIKEEEQRKEKNQEPEEQITKVRIEMGNPEFYKKYRMEDGWEYVGDGCIAQVGKKKGKK